MNKRERRRLERAKEKGPERKIVTFLGTAYEPKLAVLECGHRIENPPVQKTKRMALPSHYRCIQCLTNNSTSVLSIGVGLAIFGRRMLQSMSAILRAVKKRMSETD